MITTGTYKVEEFTYELEINYELELEDSDRWTPGSVELNITSVTLNGEEITGFYEDYLSHIFSSAVLDYAQDKI